MRRALLLVGTVAAGTVAAAIAGCERPPLPFSSVVTPPRDDAGVAPGDGGADVGGASGDGGTDASGPPALISAIPVGRQTSPTIAGATTLVAVVPLGDGGVIVAGGFEGTISFAADKTLIAGGTGSGFVARYRRDQQLVWVRALTAQSVRVADMAALGNDEVAVAGWFAGTLTAPESGSALALASRGGLDAFVIRFAADGSARWMTGAGGPGDDIARAVAAVAAGSGGASIVLTGAVGDSAVFAGRGAGTPAPAGAGPIYAARLDGDGNFLWASFAGGGVPGQGYGVAVDDAGAVSVTGYVNGLAPFGDGPGGVPITVDPADGHAYVARWDAAGRPLWALPLGGPAGEGDAIAIGASGEIVASGTFEGQWRFGAGAATTTLTADAPGVPGVFVAALSPTGAPLWARRLTGMGIRPWRLRRASGGDLLVAASFGGGVVVDPDGPRPQTLFSAGDLDPAFIRLHGDGTLAWAFAGGGPGSDQGSDLAEAADGTTWAVGDYVGPATFGAADTAVILDSGTDGNAFLLHFAR